MSRGIFVLLVCALTVVPAWPQASTATVSGTVRDQSGAVIPAAPVTLTNTATNVTARTQANEAGFFLFPGVNPGPYRLSVEVPGMQRYEAAVTVQAVSRTVVDPVLVPGQVSTSVEVAAISPMVNVDNSTIGSVLERNRIEQLPLNGRAIMTLFQTVPGMEGTYSLRAYGARVGSAEVIMDGSAESDRRWGNPPGIDGTPSTPAALDSIQEFTVQTNSVSAKMSRPTNIIVSTKSGTNQLHGTMFETNRNSGYGVARRRQDVWSKAPYLNRNEFGISGGGPLVIPGVYNGKDRTFWFVSWEGLKMKQLTNRSWSIPTMAMRNGDFSELRDAQGRLLTLYDPLSTNPQTWTRQPFNYGGKLNVIDPNRINPVSKYLFSVTPAPNVEVNPLVTENYRGLLQFRHNNWTYTNRFDHRFGDSDNMYVRLNYTNLEYIRDANRNSHFQTLDGVAGFEPNYNYPKSISLNWVHTFTPTLFNELLVSGHRDAWFGGAFDLGKNWVDEWKLPNPFGDTRFPTFLSLGMGSNSIDYSTNATKRNNNTFYILDDNITKVYRTHEFQFGFHGRYDIMNILPDQNSYPYMNFDTNATALHDPKSTPQNPLATPQTGANIANFFLGVARYDSRFQHRWYYLRTAEYALYFQDNWKVSRRLTVNLGLRWEYWPTFKEKNNSFSGLDVASHSVTTGTDLNTLYALGATLPSIVARYQALGMKFNTAKDVGLPPSLIHDNKKNFGPRAGFAYKALDGNRQFIVRGGYSLGYFSPPTYTWLDSNRSNPPSEAAFTWNPNSSDMSPDGLPNYLLRSVPTVFLGVNSQNVIATDKPAGITRGSAALTYFAPDQPDSQTHTWNLSVEKEVMENTVATVRYIGQHSANLDVYYSFNDNTPDYIWYATTKTPLPTGDYSNVARRPYDQQVLGQLREYRKTGWGNFNGLELDLTRRFSKGYAFQVFYVMGNALGMAGGTATVNALNQFMPGMAPTDYKELSRWLNYARDTSVPKHRVRGNFLVELPFGRGKLVGKNAGSILDKFIGGWQIAGMGNLRSNYFTLPTTNWDFTGEPIRQYGYQYPIQDCRSGQCFPGYLFWNGYIPANQINSYGANGKPNGVMGVPDNYRPAVQPLIPWPKNPSSSDPMYAYYGTNNVWITLNNGTSQRVGYNDGRHPWTRQYVPGVRQWGLDASLFKNVPVTERVSIRFTMDFFNVMNAPNNPNSISGEGILNTVNSGVDPRTMQLGLRVSW